MGTPFRTARTLLNPSPARLPFPAATIMALTAPSLFNLKSMSLFISIFSSVGFGYGVLHGFTAGKDHSSRRCLKDAGNHHVYQLILEFYASFDHHHGAVFQDRSLPVSLPSLITRTVISSPETATGFIALARSLIFSTGIFLSFATLPRLKSLVITLALSSFARLRSCSSTRYGDPWFLFRS